MTSKRQRVEPPSVVHVMHYARMIMENDPFKTRAPREEDRNFRALFGCPANVVLIVWNKLVEHDLLPEQGTMTHLLWTLMYCKTNPKWKTFRKLTSGKDPKTLRKWIFAFLDEIEKLLGVVIQWDRRKRGDINNDCLMSVDGVDFRIPFHGRKFFTHKWKFDSALRYEAAISIIHGDLVWINGPYEPGIWNDISIFRDGLLSELEDGERIEADDGYRGSSPRYVKCPASIGRHEDTLAMQSIVRSRHETINKRFSQWQILKPRYRGEISRHGKIFRTDAIITQICIENGEPLFQVEYEDPNFDNYYFDESDGEDDDDG